MARMEVLGTGLNVVLNQDSWDRLSKRIQEHDEMSEHILGSSAVSIWTKVFVLVPTEKNETEITEVPFLCDMESVRILGVFLKPSEYFVIEHHNNVPVINGECREGIELQHYLQDIPIGWC